ncbi:MAG: hypothetical protein OXN89_13900 [Bryobacterales bacterium]|nr:hypothetical protein [Bryobacterales bacterium]
MVVSEEQRLLLRMLLGSVSARSVIAVREHAGYSALCAASVLAAQGRTVCSGADGELPEIGRPFWEGTGLDGRIEAQLWPAIDTLRAMPDIALRLLPQGKIWAHQAFNLQVFLIEGGLHSVGTTSEA